MERAKVHSFAYCKFPNQLCHYYYYYYIKEREKQKKNLRNMLAELFFVKIYVINFKTFDGKHSTLNKKCEVNVLQNLQVFTILD